jgi:hypothetical protein
MAIYYPPINRQMGEQTMNTIHVEKKLGESLYWLREDNSAHPYAYIERIGNRWWAAIPGGSVCGYFATRSKAIAALV